ACLFSSLVLPPPSPPLFPYTTLFRSQPPLLHRFPPGRRTLRALALFPRAGVIAPRVQTSSTESTYSERGSGFSNTWSTACMKTRSEEHTSELQSLRHLVCRLLLEKKK